MLKSVIDNLYYYIIGIGIFCIALFFFTEIHPIYPYDLDDWKIMHRMRDVYPSIYEWNPTRVFPEILMPKCGELAVDFIYPLTGDLTLALGWMISLVVSLFIVAYMVAFGRYIRREFAFSQGVGLFLTLLFFIFHFLIFRHLEAENQHLFYSYDQTDYYYYVVPNLLGSILVLLFMTDRLEHFSLRSHPVAKGVLLLAIYLNVFSNLFDSILLSAFLGSFLLFQLIRSLHQHIALADFFRRYWLHVITIVAWLVAIAFEPFGGNAEEIGTTTQPFGMAIRETARNMYDIMVHQTNGLAVALIAIAIVAFFAISLRRKELAAYRLVVASLLLAAVVSAVFLVLLGTMSFPYYLHRIMSVYAVPFCLILAAMVSLAALIKVMPRMTLLLPFLVIFALCNTIRKGNTFQHVQTFLINNDVQYTYQVPPREILAQNRRYIHTIIAADRMGRDSVTIYVPRFEQEGNWPLSWSYGNALSKFLYNNHFISHPIKVNVNAEGQTIESHNKKCNRNAL